MSEWQVSHVWCPANFTGCCGNLAHRRPAIMPILPEALWNHVGAHHQKHQESDHKEPRKPEKMSCILKTAHQTLSPYSQRREEAM